MIEIELPWPDKRLSPNARNRWAKVKATEEAREYGGCLIGDGMRKTRTIIFTTLFLLVAGVVTRI